MTFANYLTFIRLFVSPIFLVVYLLYPYLGIPVVVLPYVLIFLLAVSELSDAFDGYVARRFNEVTDVGKVLDPMADSIYRISVFLTFTQPPVSVPLMLVFVFLYRDSVIGTLRTLCALKGLALAARRSGKIKAVVQAVTAFTILGMMIPHTMGYLTSSELTLASTVVMGIAGVYTLFSGADYLYANRSFLLFLLTKRPLPTTSDLLTP